MKKIITILLVFNMLPFVYAQKSLSIKDAVELALKNNFDIMVARNDADLAKINNTPGNAGMLPTVDLNGSGNYQNNQVHQKFSDGSTNTNQSLSTSTYQAGTELSWILFDGGKMFVTKNKLNEIEALGSIQYQEKVLQTQVDVIAAYYNVVRQKQQLSSINEAVNYNRERVKIAQIGFEAGSLVKTDLLQAKIDLNVVMENAINQQFAIEVAQKNLNNILGQSPETIFEISDSIPLNFYPNKSELQEKLNTSNASILSFQKQIEIARLALKENRSAYLPVVNLKAGYYLTQNNNSSGNILNNQSFGPQIGGSLVVPLYRSGENKRKTRNAEVQLQSAEFNLQSVKLQLNTDLQNTLTEFENQKRLMQIEAENNGLTKENLEISLQRLRLGQTISLEVHQAQEDYIQSCTRFINFKYNLKIAETKLKQLISTL